MKRWLAIWVLLALIYAASIFYLFFGAYGFYVVLAVLHII